MQETPLYIYNEEGKREKEAVEYKINGRRPEKALFIRSRVTLSVAEQVLSSSAAPGASSFLRSDSGNFFNSRLEKLLRP